MWLEKFLNIINVGTQDERYIKAMQYTEPRGELESPDNLLLDHLFVKLYKQLEHPITNTIANFAGILKNSQVKD